MKNSNKFLVLLFIVFVVVFAGSNAAAATPTLSLAADSNGDTVQITVNGDPNSSILFYYTKTAIGSQIISLGNTNSSGYFNYTISTSSYQIASGSTVYVTTGGINGTRSNSIAWPVTSSTSSGNITLSRTGVVISAGQSTTVTVSNYSSGSLYLSNNSNPPVANVSLSGSQITIYANIFGSTVATVCLVGNSSNCASVYITVQNSGATALTFGQSSVTIAPGQNVPISIAGGNGNYIVQNNPNSSVVQTSINGSIITLSTTSSSGSSSITVCSTDMASCGIINVTVGSVSSSSIYFSQTNPSISVGQSTNISVSGGTGTYYISANSNSSVVGATISGSVLTVLGNTNGSSLITVCSSTGGCGSITVNSNYVSNGGAITLSQNSLTVLTGQTLSVTVSGGETPYRLPFPSNSIFQSSLNGNIVTVYGVAPGVSALSVCSAGGACTTLNITVNSTSSTNQPYLGQNNISITSGQSITVSLSGNGGYYISNNSNSSVATAQININSIVVNAINSGTSNITICQQGGQCNILYITVKSSAQTASLVIPIPSQSVQVGNMVSFNVTPYGFTNPTYSITDSFSGTTIANSNINSSGYFSWTPVQSNFGIHNLTVYATDSYGHSASATTQINVIQPTQTNTNNTVTYYNFTKYLSYGDRGEDVLQLQKILVLKGFLTANPNGVFGPATVAALKRFQLANGLGTAGVVGPGTRSLLNKIPIGTTSSSGQTKEQKIQEIQKMILQLQQQLSQIQ